MGFKYLPSGERVEVASSDEDETQPLQSLPHDPEAGEGGTLASGASLSPEQLSTIVSESWQLELDLEHLTKESVGFLNRNLLTFVIAGMSYCLVLLIVEYFFWHSFGRSTFHHSHRAGLDGVHYSGFAVQRSHPMHLHHEPHLTLTHQVLHVVSMYLHRVFVWYPMLFSFFRAIFNGMRNPSGLVSLNDCFSFYKLDRFANTWVVGTVLFVLSFSCSLHWTMLPLWVYMQSATFFVIPLCTDHPHLPLPAVFSASLNLANSHIVHVTTIVLCSMFLQILGIVALIAGVFITGPLALIFNGVTYHSLVGVRGVKRVMRPMSIT